MNGYVCYYNGQRVEIHADTTLAAQVKATAHFQAQFRRRKVKQWEVSVMLAELNGEQYVHTAVN